MFHFIYDLTLENVVGLVNHNHDFNPIASHTFGSLAELELVGSCILFFVVAGKYHGNVEKLKTMRFSSP